MREKVASDLAYLLDLAVPPAILFPADEERPWGKVLCAWVEAASDVDGSLEHDRRQAYSAFRPFACWIGDPDRRTVNTCLIGPKGAGVVAIDFGHALNFGRRLPTWWMGDPRDRHWYPCDAEIVAAYADQISALPDMEIRRVIERVPERYLQRWPSFKEWTLSALLHRKRPEVLKEIMQEQSQQWRADDANAWWEQQIYFMRAGC